MAPLVPGPSLFLQPHYDDVALSCGALAAAWARSGYAPHLVTVFASEVVHGMVGAFARWKHSRWQVDDPDAVASTRRQEDERAAAALGCTLRWLGLPDAIYRGDRYTSDASLYAAPHPEEADLPRHLADELVHLPEWRQDAQVFVPLAVGDHVDHQLVFETGRQLAGRGVRVWAYEDLPYGIHTPSALPARLARLGPAIGDAVLVPVGGTLDAKLQAVAAYGSQVPVIFRFTEDYRAALRAHALALGRELGPVERIWPVRG